MLKRLKNESGSVTVEATISLSTFMFAIVTILTIVNICLVQARMSYAINTTAKEISQYSYLYSLTGLNDSQSQLNEQGKTDTEKANKLLSDINTVYTEIENLGGEGSTNSGIEDINSKWDEISGKLTDGVNTIADDIEDIADNPKQLIFGVAKLAGSGAMDLAKSKLIMEPLARAMCKKHLVNEKGGSVDAYLKFLGVVPNASGSYYKGVSFRGSTLFPNGSNQIKVCVSYDVKVISLLPIDFSFHFEQCAITHGWLAGSSSYKPTKQFADNDTLWTQATINERSSFIRHQAIADMQDDGYAKTSGLTDVQLYNKDKNEFVMIASMNPLWSAEGEPALTLADLDEVALQTNIERLCGKIASSTDGVTKITTKTEKDGKVTKTEHDCTGAKNKIVLVIPEDKDLDVKIQEIINKSDTRGVEIEIVAAYGNGARSSEVVPETGKSE